jgi:NAD(P)-dependent dehydrogenase (short-subunit alcohol dehydrogenase family)
VTVRTVLVTGANRGLGRETARQLGGRGFRVIGTARTDRDLETMKQALRTDDGEADARSLDVSSGASISALASGIVRDSVRLDVLVNNAGIALDGFDARVAQRTLDVNFFGVMGLTDRLAPSILDGGSIVMVSSGLGELACVSPALRKRFLAPELTRAELVAMMRGFVADVENGRHVAAGWPSSAYRVSKVGLNALTRLLAWELRGRRIRVNAVCPGWVRTDLGGAGADRSVEDGASSIVATSALDGGPTGGFFRDGEPIDW